MLNIGKFNTLKVLKIVDFGIYLDGGNGISILLPVRYISKAVNIGDELDVFIYTDSEDRLIATTETPLTQVGKFSYLDVKSVNKVGAFLDWGLMKDLLVPFSEQRSRMKQGGSYLVYTYLDDTTKRVVASSKIEKFLGNTIPLYTKGTKVHCLIYDENDIGYKIIVENLHKGIIYKNQVYQNLEIGDEIDGFVKQIRDDNKIDVTINDIAVNRIDELAKRFHNFISINGGSTSLGDKSSPEEIKAIMSCSKKDLKKAIGLLYKQHLITINNGIIINQK
ncbi:MAG: GntR family transcriptional regulator [Muribaculaceae bacterium]|nr:GntR family transcriptional regulator [Muribaculaceae bacterium]